jgi:hypothetical protein
VIAIVTQTPAIAEEVKRLLDFPKNFGSDCQFHATREQDVGFLADCVRKHQNPDLLIIILEHDPGHPKYSHDDLDPAVPRNSLDQLRKDVRPLVNLILRYLTLTVPQPDDGWV